MTDEKTTKKICFDDSSLVARLLGTNNSHLDEISSQLGVQLSSRGTEVSIAGSLDDVIIAQRLLSQLYGILKKGHTLYPSDIVYALRIFSQDSNSNLEEIFLDAILVTTRKKLVAPKSLAQKLYIDAIRRNDIVFGIGPAGTGKTYLAMAMALAALKKKKVSRIILVRPAVEAGEKLGFLPGDITEKVNPYLRPLYDALFEMFGQKQAMEAIDQGIVEVAPLAFMRGRTLNDAFVILDEAQNTTLEQMKMFLTRLGFGSQAVVTGDITQIDLPSKSCSGMVEAIRVLKNVDRVFFNYFSSIDVVRHPVVQAVIQAYEAADIAKKSK